MFEMKLAWIDLVLDSGTPLDTGIVVTEGASTNFELLGYGGWAVEHHGFETLPDIFEKMYPQITKVNSVLPAQGWEEADANMLEFLLRYAEEGEEVVLVHRIRLEWVSKVLPGVFNRITSTFDLKDIARVMDFLAIPSEYEHDQNLRPERAVGRAMYHHAEAQLYGNNIQAWGNDALQEKVDHLAANQCPIVPEDEAQDGDVIGHFKRVVEDPTDGW